MNANEIKEGQVIRVQLRSEGIGLGMTMHVKMVNEGIISGAIVEWDGMGGAKEINGGYCTFDVKQVSEVERVDLRPRRNCEMTVDPARDGLSILQAVSKMCNFMGNKEAVDNFVGGFLSEHRTLQQSMTAVFLKCLYALASQEQHDLRNEAAWKAAKKIRETLGDYGDHLPSI
jgi:hypothetical protein